MKTLQYLQKVGAVPEYEKWDLLMAIVTITKELFCPDLVMEPDVIQWTQDAEDNEEFDRRCNAVLYATSGDVRALYPHVCDESEEFLKGLIRTLLEIRLFYFCPEDPGGEEEEWFTRSYNDFLDLKGNGRFPSKSAILHFMYGGGLIAAGQETMAELVGTEENFMESVLRILADFVRFATLGSPSLEVREVKIQENGGNPFEGGPQIRLRVGRSGEEKTEECTLHWAPWPTAKSMGKSEDIVKLCESFTESSRKSWFESLLDKG